MGKKTDINTAKFLLKSSSKNRRVNMKFVVNKISYLLSKKGNSIKFRKFSAISLKVFLSDKNSSE